MRSFTRELMDQASRDLGTRLDWVAVDHWNTEHPHIHILVRGRADEGSDLVISRDYIGTGLRARAGNLVTRELGPRSERQPKIQPFPTLQMRRFRQALRRFAQPQH